MMFQLDRSALIVVDVQNGFTPGGHLAVAEADQIIPTINRSLAKVNLRASNSPFQQLNSFLDQSVSVYFYSVLLISENV